MLRKFISSLIWCKELNDGLLEKTRNVIGDERGDVPGWVLVVLMTTGLVTGIWALAEPRLSSLLNDSLNSMNNIR